MTAPDQAPVTVSAPAAKQPWLDPQWRDFHKLWSMRIAFLVMLLTGGEMAIPAFINWLPPRLFALLCFVLVIALGVTRLLNQSSTDL